MSLPNAHDQRPAATVHDLRFACGVERGVTFALLTAGCLLAAGLRHAPPPVLTVLAAIAALVVMRVSSAAWVGVLLPRRAIGRIVGQFTVDGIETAAAAACGILLAVAPTIGAIAVVAMVLGLIGREIRLSRRAEAPFAAAGGRLCPEAIEFARHAGFDPECIVVDDDAEAVARLIHWHGRPHVLLAPHVPEAYKPAEIRAVVAHELGHWARHDLMKAAIGRIVLQVVAAAVTAVLTALALHLAGDAPAAATIAVISGALGLAVFEVLSLPGLLWLSRRIERGANEWALAATADPDAFAEAMVKLHDHAGAPPEPTWWHRLLICDHPSLNETLRQAHPTSADD